MITQVGQVLKILARVLRHLVKPDVEICDLVRQLGQVLPVAVLGF
jgi:hypothetical protein